MENFNSKQVDEKYHIKEFDHEFFQNYVSCYNVKNKNPETIFQYMLHGMAKAAGYNEEKESEFLYLLQKRIQVQINSQRKMRTTKDLIDALDRNEGPFYIRIEQPFDDELMQEESIDVGTIVQVYMYIKDFQDDTGIVYMIYFSIEKKLYPLHQRLSKRNWYDKQGEPTLTYLEARFKNYKNREEVTDILYMMDYFKDWYTVLSEEEVEEIIKKYQ